MNHRFRMCAVLTLSGLVTFSAIAAAEEVLKVAIAQRGNWENSASELGQAKGIFKKHGWRWIYSTARAAARQCRRLFLAVSMWVSALLRTLQSVCIQRELHFGLL